MAHRATTLTDDTTVAELAAFARRSAAAMREVGDTDEADRVAVIVLPDGECWLGSTGLRRRVPSMDKAVSIDPEFMPKQPEEQ